MKKVLFLSYDGLTDPLGQSQILPYLLGLAQIGHQITIISFEKPQNCALRKNIIEALVLDKIDWQPIFYTKNPPVFSTLFDVWQMRKKAVQLHKIKHFDIIHCRSYVSALVGEYLKDKFKTTMPVKFIFDMRGFWADERVDGSLWNLKNPVFNQIYKFFKRKETDFLLKADTTITLTENAKTEILSWQNLKEQSSQKLPIKVIPCCVDTVLFDFEEQKNTPNTENKPFILSYLGSLGTWYLVDEMLHFFSCLLKTKPDAIFSFITPDNPSIILEKIQKYNISAEKIIIQKAERKEVPNLIKESNISIFFIKTSYSKKGSSATKLGEILACGVPTIINGNMGDNDYLFEKYNFGALVKEFSENAYMEVIKNLDKILVIPPERLRNVALDYFSLEKGIQKYNEVYTSITDKI